jgi:hypothetical protein
MKIVDTGLLHTQAYVDGRWLDADSGETFEVFNSAGRQRPVAQSKQPKAHKSAGVRSQQKSVRLSCAGGLT